MRNSVDAPPRRIPKAARRPASRNYAWRRDALRRTAYFPGLGWMTSKKRWEALFSETWSAAPTTGWDHWLRANTGGRECVFPELPRVRHAATGGSTNVRGGEADALEKFAFAGDGGGGSVSTFRLEGFDAEELRRTVSALPRVSLEAARGLSGNAAAGLLVARLPEDHPKLARALDLWHTEPRGYDRHGVLVLRRAGGAALYLADARRCDFLGETERIAKPADAALVAAGAAGVSCDDACRAAGRRCDDRLLAFADACAFMREHFDCPKGCGHQLGPELPAFVARPGRDTSGQCLIANGGFTPACGARHPATQRLCFCASAEHH